MTKRRVVITGMGVISPYGLGVDKFWKSLCEGKSGIDTIKNMNLEKHTTHIAGEVPNDIDFEQFMDAKEIKRTDRYSVLGNIAADLAIEDSKLNIEDEATGETNFVGSYTEGDEVTLPENTNTREGYAFAGWKVGEEVLKAGDTFTVSGNTTISAVWNLYGDFDGDNTVDAKETAMVRKFLIGKPDKEFVKEFADVNLDGEVDICDLVSFVKNLK